MQTNLQSTDGGASATKTMLTQEELSARTGIAEGTFKNWRSRRNAGEDIGPKFVKVGGLARYLIKHVAEWEAKLAKETAA